MIFLTATLYSGMAAAFQSLLGILRPELETGVLESLSDAYLRQAMREVQGDLRLVPTFPPDLLGLVVFQPLVSL